LFFFFAAVACEKYKGALRRAHRAKVIKHQAPRKKRFAESFWTLAPHVAAATSPWSAQRTFAAKKVHVHHSARCR
jgi:hypothetical protein